MFTVEERLHEVEELLRSQAYQGYDPFDILNAPLLSDWPKAPRYRFLLSRLGARLFPIFIRRLLGQSVIEDPKTYACAYFGYSFMPEAGAQRKEMIASLCRIAQRSADGLFWGYDFEWPSRYDGISPRGASTLVPAAFALLALEHESIVHGDATLISRIRDGIGHLRAQHKCGTDPFITFGYFPTSRHVVHNANLLGCAAIAIGAHLCHEERWMTDVSRAARISVNAVREDGYVPYSEHHTGNWSDAFHHLYVLGCLLILDALRVDIPREELRGAINRLAGYYERRFIRPDGTLNYFPDRVYPIDCHNYAASILFQITTPETIRWPKSAREMAEIADEWTWHRRKRHYIHKRYRYYTDARKFLRWNQAWMFLALAAIAHERGCTEQLRAYRSILDRTK